MSRPSKRSKSYRLSRRSSANQQILNCNSDSDGDLNPKRNSWWTNLSDGKRQTNSQLHPSSYNILDGSSVEDSEYLKSKWWKDRTQNESIDFLDKIRNNDEQPEKNISKSDSAINESEHLVIKKNIFGDKTITQKSRFSRAFILKNEAINKSEEIVQNYNNVSAGSPKEKVPVKLNKKKRKTKSIFSKKSAKRKFSDVFNVEEEYKKTNCDDPYIEIEMLPENNDKEKQNISHVNLTNEMSEISTKKSLFKAKLKNKKYSQAFVMTNDQMESHEVSELETKEHNEARDTEISSYTKQTAESKKTEFSGIDTLSSNENFDKQMKHNLENKNSEKKLNESSNAEKRRKLEESENASHKTQFVNENLFKVKHTNKKYSEAFALSKQTVQNFQGEKSDNEAVANNDTNFSTISSINLSENYKPTLFRPKARKSLYIETINELSNIQSTSRIQSQKITTQRFSLRSLDSGITRFDDSLISSTKFDIIVKESSEESKEKPNKSQSKITKTSNNESKILEYDKINPLSTKSHSKKDLLSIHSSAIDENQYQSIEEANEYTNTKNENKSKHSLKSNKLRSSTSSKSTDVLDNEENFIMAENAISLDKTQQQTKRSSEEAQKKERLSQLNKDRLTHSLKANKSRSRTSSESSDHWNNEENDAQPVTTISSTKTQQIKMSHEEAQKKERLSQLNKDKLTHSLKSNKSGSRISSESSDHWNNEENVAQPVTAISSTKTQQIKMSHEEAQKKERLSQLNKDKLTHSLKSNKSGSRISSESADHWNNEENVAEPVTAISSTKTYQKTKMSHEEAQKKERLSQLNKDRLTHSLKSNKSISRISSESTDHWNNEENVAQPVTAISSSKTQQTTMSNEEAKKKERLSQLNKDRLTYSSKSNKSRSRISSESSDHWNNEENVAQPVTTISSTKTQQHTNMSHEEAQKKERLSQLNKDRLTHYLKSNKSRSRISLESMGLWDNEENVIQTENATSLNKTQQQMDKSNEEAKKKERLSQLKKVQRNVESTEKLQSYKKDSIYNQMNTIEKRNFREFSQFEPEPIKPKTLLENIKMSQNDFQANKRNVEAERLKEKNEMLLKFIKKSKPATHSQPALNKITSYFTKLDKNKNLGAFPKANNKINRKPKPICTARMVNGKMYSKKLFHGKKWCTQKFYKFLQNKMEHSSGEYTISKSEELMKYIVEIVNEIIKSKDYPKRKIENFKKELTKNNVISTTFDFYHFVAEYLPAEFRDKVVPCTRAHTSEPTVPYDHEKLFEQIKI